MMRRLDVEKLPLVGTTVIEASAGTGKTYTITSLFLRLLVERGMSVDQILVVTYTRAATAELRDRIRARLALALTSAQGRRCDDSFVAALCERAAQRTSRESLARLLEQALSNIDQAPILTIHAFCQRVLRDHAFESGVGFGLTLTAHSAPIIDEIIADYYTSQLFDTSTERARLLCDEAGRLRSLAMRAGSDEGVRVIPEVASHRSLSPLAWRRAQARCRELWEKDREAIKAQVGAAKGIGQWLGKWCTQMSTTLERDEPGFTGSKHPFVKGFVYFTTSGMRAKGVAATHPFFAAAEEFREEDARLLSAQHEETVAFRAGFVRYLRQELDRRAKDSEVRTFDALLTDLSRALAGERAEQLVSALRKKFRAALVDEFQDTDPAQYTIFRRLFGDADAPLLLIGDPKQAIYAFRGADVQAYLAARDDAGEAVYTLDVNRRSDSALVSALNRLYALVDKPFLVSSIAYQPVSVPESARQRFMAPDGRAPLDLVLVESTGENLRREVARRTAEDIAGLLQSGARRVDDKAPEPRARALCAADIAVLCRTNAEAYEVQQALTALSVPSVLSGDASVFDSEDAAHVERTLTALAHPTDPRAMRSFLCSLYGGRTAQELLALELDDEAWDAHSRRFRELHELFVSRGFTQALRALCAHYRVEERLLKRPDGMRRITNLNHLGELLSGVSLTERLGPLGLLRWLETARKDAAARNELPGDSHELRLESSETAVQLTTVHKSKGLEYPVVYCPFLYGSASLRADDKTMVRFHDPKSEGALTLDLGSPDQADNTAIAAAESLAEALRLLYVALTRAKHRVCLLLPVDKRSADAALVYTLLGGGGSEQIGEARPELSSAVAYEEALTSLARACAPLVSLRKLRASSHHPTQLPAQQREPLTARIVRRAVDSAHRTASFTSLVAGRAVMHDGADHDALVATDDAPTDPVNGASPLTLETFPRGAGPGQLIHEVLENLAFDAPEVKRREAIEGLLRARGHDLGLLELLHAGLAEVLETPLDARGLTLSGIKSTARVNELEFLFPVQSALTPRALARVFKAHGAPAADPGYVRYLESLSFESLRGYLRGFIDLIFEHEGRFYLVDYKSNYLGAAADDYEQPTLLRSMAEHHYFLQYHLYGLALHRYLRHRLSDYAYEAHFGGVYYLFLRGMAKNHPLGTGVFFDLPPKALLEALDRCMTNAPETAHESLGAR